MQPSETPSIPRYPVFHWRTCLFYACPVMPRSGCPALWGATCGAAPGEGTSRGLRATPHPTDLIKGLSPAGYVEGWARTRGSHQEQMELWLETGLGRGTPVTQPGQMPRAELKRGPGPRSGWRDPRGGWAGPWGLVVPSGAREAPKSRRHTQKLSCSEPLTSEFYLPTWASVLFLQIHCSVAVIPGHTKALWLHNGLLLVKLPNTRRSSLTDLETSKTMTTLKVSA